MRSFLSAYNDDGLFERTHMNKLEKRPTFPCIICGKRYEYPYGF